VFEITAASTSASIAEVYTCAMRFLRMLTNALVAGALGAAYLTVLVLQLNPDIALLSATTWWWFVTLGMLYGLVFAVVLYLVIVSRDFFAMQALSPGWISVRLLAWLGAALSAGAAGLMWLNARGLSAALDEERQWRMTAGAIATTVSSVVLLSIAVAHYSFGRRGSRVGASLLLIAVAGSIALPIAARGRGAAAEARWTQGTVPRTPHVAEALAEQAPRMTLILLDGASLQHIWLRAAEGRLPNIRRILDRGAALDLATVRPTQPSTVWTSVATGMYPWRNGVRSASRYFARQDTRGVELLPDHSLSHALVQLGFVRDRPLTTLEWRARPLWGILADAGLTAGVVRWPLTHPARGEAGFVVSERLHAAGDTIAGLANAVYPASARAIVQQAHADEGFEAPRDFAPGSPEATALERDTFYARIGEALRGARTPAVFAVRYEGLDTIGHHYFKHAFPEGSRSGDEEPRRYSRVIDEYYAFVDGEVGSAVGRMLPGDLLLVVAGFGMEAVNPVKKVLGRLLMAPHFSGTHERAPDGFLLAYGNAVRPGRPPRGSIVDVTPTILYFFGLPVARDMDGYARTDLFTAEFSADRPVTFVPSYR
jgi:predicted AlkP superfamily phosphohydrolase/phosphomutase